MPPKSSSRGRPRRATRRSLPADQAPPAGEPFSPPSSTSSAAAAAAAAAATLPLQSPSVKTTSASLSSPVPRSQTPLISETLPSKGAVLGAANVPGEPPLNDAVLDSGRSLDQLEVGNPNPVLEAGRERGQDATVVEDSGKETANGGSGVGKTKKTVKKTIRVVKKIVKKVPKRIVKGVPDSRVEGLGAPGANDDRIVPNSDSLSNCLNSGVNEEQEVKPSVENRDPDVSLSMEVEQSQQKVDLSKENVENVQTLEVQGQKEGASMEVDENVDELPGEALCAAAIGEKENDELEVKENPSGALDAAADGVRDGEKRAEEVEDGDTVAKPEYEMGEGLYYSGEMEAMERRKRRKREIFVGGLDKNAKEEDIRKVFEEVGEVSEVRLMMNGNTGKNKGYAFLCYASALDAKKALEKFSKVEICGKECGALPLEGNDTIYLGSIDKKWKEEDIVKLVQDIGIEGIDTVLVMKDPNNKEYNRGFAFIEFETCRDAKIAFKKLQKKDVFGKNSKIKVAWAEQLNEPNEAEMQKVKTVYAEYIPSTWDEEKVKENFKKFGEIENLVLSRNLKNAKRKDYAFISYRTREAAIACIESFNRQLHNDEGMKTNVKVSLARPISRGRQSKQVPKPVSKEGPKERPKASQGNVTVSQIGPIKTGGSTIHHHYDIQRPHLHQKVVPREERSSTTSELVQLLREQAAWRPPHAGPLNVDYSTTFSGRKRPVSTLDTDPVHSDMSGYPHYRLETNLPSNSRYGAFPQSGTSTSLPHYLGQAGYSSGVPYGVARNYLGSERRDKAHGSSSSYRRY